MIILRSNHGVLSVCGFRTTDYIKFVVPRCTLHICFSVSSLPYVQTKVVDKMYCSKYSKFTRSKLPLPLPLPPYRPFLYIYISVRLNVALSTNHPVRDKRVPKSRPYMVRRRVKRWCMSHMPRVHRRRREHT